MLTEDEACNPYETLPKSAFWRIGVAEASPFELDGLYRKKYEITPISKIATAGSCFAQHISRHLTRHGYSVLDVEPAPHWLPENQRKKYGYSTYSARYGNIYTVRQLLQLVREVSGEFDPQEICWERKGRFYDALRPSVEPGGFERESDLRLHRKHHLERVREMLVAMDIFIFTLGLTEAWVHKRAGTVYPIAPGVIAGTFDKSLYQFANYGFTELERDFWAAMRSINEIRKGRPQPRILLTVSPVPLTATASGLHVLQATTYSKAVLRALAGQLAMGHDFIDYFPSYEIIMNQAARGIFFEANQRSVRTQGVETVMKVFFASHNPPVSSADICGISEVAPVSTAPTDEEEKRKEESDVQCDVAILEAFA